MMGPKYYVDWVHHDSLTAATSNCDHCVYKNGLEFHACHICQNEVDMYREKKTNGDSVREMSNKELAKMFQLACPPTFEDGRCPNAPRQINEMADGQGVKDICEPCWLKWLDEEVQK